MDIRVTLAFLDGAERRVEDVLRGHQAQFGDQGVPQRHLVQRDEETSDGRVEGQDARVLDGATYILALSRKPKGLEKANSPTMSNAI